MSDQKSKSDQRRDFLKDSIRKELDFSRTDQNKGFKAPPFQKPYDEETELINLPGIDEFRKVCNIDLFSAIDNRKSRRKFLDSPLSLKELAFLLWATQGIKDVRGHSTLRTVPSAGARHSFETYIYVRRVNELKEGTYRYLAVEHKLLFLRSGEALSVEISEACLGQGFAGDCAATFIWTTLPYRTEWRYSLAAHKTIAIDVGHVCQNLYLACEGIGAGTCAIGAYDQELMDEFVSVDGDEEFVIYLAPVGKI